MNISITNSFFTRLICLFTWLIIGHLLYANPDYTKKDTFLIKNYYENYRALQKNSVHYNDSASWYLNNALILAEQLQYKEHNIKLYREYGKILSETGRRTHGLDYFHKALNELDKKITVEGKKNEHRIEYIKIYVSIGLGHLHMQNIDESQLYLERALQEIAYLPSENEDFDVCHSMVVIYINMLAICIDKKDYLTARIIFEKAISSVECIKDNDKNKEIRRANLYNNISIVHRELKEVDKSLSYCYKAIEIYNNHDLDEYLPQAYNNLGATYCEAGQYEKAIKYLQESIEISQKYLNLRSEKIALTNLVECYKGKKDYYNALLMREKELILTENLLKQDNHSHIKHIENFYQYEKVMTQERLEQEIKLARKEKKLLIYIIIIGNLLVICLVLAFFYRNTKIKINQKRLEAENLKLEKQNLDLENRELEKEILDKNKELTTQVMYLNEKNTFIASIMKELSGITKKEDLVPVSRLSELINQMKKNVEQNSWDEFEVYFKKVNQDFYKNLNELAPDLSVNEKRLCSFLRLNMTTKEIATLTFQSIKSIQIARIRLRKKLNIERNEDLVSLLQNL